MSSTGNANLHKLNIRNIISIIFVVGYFLFLFSATGILGNKDAVIKLEDSPVITMLLGILSAALTLIIQFFFRRATPQ